MIARLAGFHAATSHQHQHTAFLPQRLHSHGLAFICHLSVSLERGTASGLHLPSVSPRLKEERHQLTSTIRLSSLEKGAASGIRKPSAAIASAGHFTSHSNRCFASTYCGVFVNLTVAVFLTPSR